MPLRHGADRYDLARLKSVVQLCDQRTTDEVAACAVRAS